MSLAILKQNAEILAEVASNYEKLLEEKKNAGKDQAGRYDIQIKNFRNQFLYLLTAIHKNVEQEKNAR